MKKIVNIFILVVVCLLPTVVDAKLNYKFDWELENLAFLYKENNEYNFLEFYYSVYNDYLYKFDENGNFLEDSIFVDDEMSPEEFSRTKEFEYYKNLYTDVYNSIYNEDNLRFYDVYYYNETMSYYDLDTGYYVPVGFEEDLENTKRILGKNYDIYLIKKNNGYDVDVIKKYDNYYVVYYYNYDEIDGNYNNYISIFDEGLNEVIKFNFEDEKYKYIYIHDGLIYALLNNLKIDIYKLDGTKYDTMNLEHDVITSLNSSCSGFRLYRMLIEDDELFLHYSRNECPSRIEMNDASDVDNLAKSNRYVNSYLLKYSLHYDVEKVESSNGEFTYEVKEDEDGKSYVELKITPKDGYSVKEIIVTDINGDRIEVTNNRFYKPLNDVKIEVKYVEGEYLPIPDTGLSKSLTLILIGLILVGLGYYTINYVRNDKKVDI